MKYFLILLFDGIQVLLVICDLKNVMSVLMNLTNLHQFQLMAFAFVDFLLSERGEEKAEWSIVFTVEEECRNGKLG
jgi:hypothetical protein